MTDETEPKSDELEEENREVNAPKGASNSVPEPRIDYSELGFVTGYYCPFCGSLVEPSHVDDVGTEWFKCQKCAEFTAKPKTQERKDLEEAVERLKDVRRPTTLEEIGGILNSTIKHDYQNKVITFLGMILTYTEEDQINLSFTAESSTGKSYIPLELAWYFPKDDVIEYAYVSPTAFFHEYGTLLPDPEDHRDVEEKKKRKLTYINLNQKILIFIDQPHDMLLQRLRPMLSHDRRTLVSKITDRHKKGGLATKTVVVEGYPTVLFCSAKFSMEDQERTRLLMLSPETSHDKIKDAILLKIEKESNRQAFHKYMESDLGRNWLRGRVEQVAEAGVRFVVIPEELRKEIAERFFQTHNSLIPRHQRDVSRLLAMIKAHALLNLWHRQRVGEFEEAIVVNEEDVTQGSELYNQVSTANEIGLPPEVYDTYVKLAPQINELGGVTRKEFQSMFYSTFRRTIGKKRLEEVLLILQQVGLVTEDLDPNDKRQKKILLTGQGVFNFGTQNGVKTAEKIDTLRHVSKKFSLDEVVGWAYLLELKGTCGSCGKEATLTREVSTFKKSFKVCEDCGLTIMKELKGRGEEG